MRERLRETADVDHPVAGVEALERRRRIAGVVELALVVVLDDDDVTGLRSREERQATIDRHRDGRRALVAGRHVDGAAAGQRRADDQPAVVDRQRHDASRVHPEDVARVRIAGILDADRRLGRQQQAGQQKRRMLRPGRQQDVVPLCPDAARRQQPGLDLVDQGVAVLVEMIGCPVGHRPLAQRFQRTLAPFREREQLSVELAIDERIRIALPVARLDDVPLLDEGARHSLPPVGTFDHAACRIPPPGSQSRLLDAERGPRSG